MTRTVRRWPSALAVAAGVALLVEGLALLGLFEPFELRTVDLRMQRLRDSRAFRDDIVFIDISQRALSFCSREHKWSWPWPRDVYGGLFAYFKEGGARCVLCDFVFTEPDVNGAARDRDFGEAAADFGHVIQATPFEPSAAEDVAVGADFVKRFSVPTQGDPPALAVQALIPPVEPIWKGVRRVGCPRIDPDPDGVNRRYPLLVRHGRTGTHYPSLALAAAMDLTGASEASMERGFLRVGNLRIPADSDGNLLLLYGASQDKVHRYEAHEVIQSFIRKAEGQSVSVPPQAFKDKIVIITSWAPGLKDLRATPLSRIDAGAIIHATALSNLLNQDFLLRLPRPVSAGLLVALTLVVALLTRLLPLRWSIPLVLAAVGGLYGGAGLAFRDRMWVDLVGPTVSTGLAFAGVTALNYLIEGRQRARTRRAFSSYVAPTVVAKILQNPDGLTLEGERKPITVLFLDFAGFTTLSETLDPSALVKLLNQYHNEAVEEIHRTEGTLDKFIGDAIMAFWNDPVEQPDHPARACISAVRIQERLRKLAESMREQGLTEMQARVGINTGVVTVGNMGSNAQFNYTAIGDEVNLASRLEGVNKEFGTRIIASEHTLAGARDRVEVRELALIRVKGKKLPVRIFEVLGVKGEVPADRLAAARKFEEALSLFRERKWSEARQLFGAVADAPSRVYQQLCDRYAADPPDEAWNGVYIMEHK